MSQIPSFTTSSGTTYRVVLSERAGVVATCTASTGRVVVLDVLDSRPGPVIFRRDHSVDSRELAHHVAAWFMLHTEPLKS